MGFPKDFAYPDPSDQDDPRTAQAVAAWNAIARLFLSQQGHRDKVAAELGLNMAEIVPLFHLDPAAGIPQRDLALQWTCDPSWVTNRIDRLEELGLAERRVSATDRRVKEVWLTPEGCSRREAGQAGFADPPEELRGLSDDDLQALAAILAKIELPEATS